MASQPPAKILIVDDHPMVRDGLAGHLATESDLVVCGQAEMVPEAIALVKSLEPDLAIIDISLKNGNGIDLIKRIRAFNATVRLLVWSMYPENQFAERALRAGAQGYIHKGLPADDLLDAIRTVLAGKIYLSGAHADQLLQRLVGGHRASRSLMDSLSDRELELFECIGQGMTTEQIAEAMHVSPKTVETYRSRVKEKLNLHTMTELIQHAVQWVLEQK